MATNPQPHDSEGTPHGEAPDLHVAANMIRDKVARVYREEPRASQELAEAEVVSHRSKHQQFVYDLSNSGKDLATIQTDWHNYYQRLSAAEKHQVWQEFYESQSVVTGQALPVVDPAQSLAKHKHEAAQPAHSKAKPAIHEARTSDEVRTAIRHKVSAGGRLKPKHHLQSLLFGLSMGAVVVIIFLFGFFNEVIIAPFIQPSRAVAATPLIVSSSSVAPTATPEVIIPKINVEIPVDYSQTTTDESIIENALESGVVHYPTTVMPGQNGNTAFFGHSSNNIFNKGKYKFAFVLLHTLVPGDTFYLTYQSKVYVYKVITRTIVDPSEVGVLGPVDGQTATATLITCDPPGTSLHRLVVVGQQISPDPAGNTTPATTASVSNGPSELPGNGPTLWGRFITTGIGKVVVALVFVGLFLWILRWVNRPRRQARN